MGKFALLIGVGSYRSSDLQDLLAAPRDVEAMQRVLADPAIGGFAVEDVCVLQNPEPQEMRVAIERLFTNRKRDDLVLLYFSGHGVVNDAGLLHLTTTETEKSLMNATAIPASFIHGLMELRGKDRSQYQVVILDCCYSGAFAKGMAAKGSGVNLLSQLGGKGRAVLTSSSETEPSFEQKDGELSVYTQYVVEGLRTGIADKDEDGWISVDELHEFAAMKVREAAPAMQPKIYAVEEGYKIFVAKAPVGDPKLAFRKEVEKWAKQRNGVISSVLKRGFIQRFQGQLSINEIDIILNEVLQPYREFQKNLREFEEAFEEVSALPFSQQNLEDLNYLQHALGLRDEDVAQWMQTITALPQEEIKSTDGTINNENINPTSFEFTTAQVDVKGKLIGQSTKQVNGFKDDLGNGVTIDMIAIPGGTFMMGSPTNEEKRGAGEGPQHSVTVPEFWMGRFAVTQAQWRRVAGTEKVSIDLDADPSNFKGQNRPVEQVSWDEATEFCSRLSRATNRVYRLPSESEWEYTCRAGTDTPFSFGPTLNPDVANYDGNYVYGKETKGKYRQETTDVGSFPANGFGLYDMHGNVWEWCQDWWHDDYSKAATDGSAQLNQQSDKLYRLLRGGSWYNYPWYCRSANRYWYSPDFRNYYIGFRVACSHAS
jgi:formylglycine-generating enzyme required for sulfatase activity